MRRFWRSSSAAQQSKMPVCAAWDPGPCGSRGIICMRKLTPASSVMRPSSAFPRRRPSLMSLRPERILSSVVMDLRLSSATAVSCRSPARAASTARLSAPRTFASNAALSTSAAACDAAAMTPMLSSWKPRKQSSSSVSGATAVMPSSAAGSAPMTATAAARTPACRSCRALPSALMISAAPRSASPPPLLPSAPPPSPLSKSPPPAPSSSLRSAWRPATRRHASLDRLSRRHAAITSPTSDDSRPLMRCMTLPTAAAAATRKP
mmetsp:Transcript_13503/g.40026  ORF Transcript_13503/g.40026 Transcript_13503/m.40026 type:complete len:264 (-) Transcript_13503:692-1483(-)